MAQEIKLWNNGIGEDQAGSTLPTVNADDNGKTLQVVNGQWDKGDKIPENELPSVTTADNNKVLAVYNGGWAKRKLSDAYRYIFITAWGGDPTVQGITIDEFDSLSSVYVPTIMGGYSGTATMSPVVFSSVGAVGTSILVFEAYEPTATGVVKYLFILGATGSGVERKFTVDVKKFTLTADT